METTNQKAKSVHTTFTLKKDTCPPVRIDQAVITAVGNSKIPRHPFRQAPHLARTHNENKETPGNQDPRTILAYKQTFAALPKE